MAMKLSEVKAKTKVVNVVFMDEQVDVSYHPAAMTPAILEEVMGLAKGAETDSEEMALIGSMLEPVLDWWDVLDDDGNRLPTTKDSIRQMPLAFLMKVLDDVQADMRPPAQKG